MKTPWLLLTAAALCVACDEAEEPPAADLARPDAGRDLIAPDRQQGPDAAPVVPFTPADLTLGQMACVAAGLSTGSSAAAEASRQLNLGRLKAAGIRLMRTGFLWHRVEKTKGTFDFSGYDRRVKAALSANIDHIALLAYGNPWATTKTTSDPMYPPDDPADFARFVKATVTRYKGKISTYEIWNEPNAGFRFWKTNPKGDPAAYGALLKAAFKAAREADPKARVLFGGPFYHDQVIPGHLKFLADAYKQHPDLGKHLDGMALHPYAIYPPSVWPEKLDAWERPVNLMLASVRALMAKNGGARPIYTTEVGWPVYKQVSEAQQASYLVRSFLVLAAAGSRAYCWYTLRDLSGHGVPTEATFGLFTYTADGKAARAKPSWTAYKTLINTLGSYRLVRDLRKELALPETAFAYRLRDPKTGAWATAVWGTTPGTTVLVPLEAATTKVTRVEMLGTKSALTPKAGQVMVKATTTPVYVLED